jgi:hypothetical protein
MSESRAEIDIRWPIGLLFTVIGLLVSAYGAFHGDQSTPRPLGFNLNFWWGILMFLFGVGMSWGAYRAGRKQP